MASGHLFIYSAAQAFRTFSGAASTRLCISKIAAPGRFNLLPSEKAAEAEKELENEAKKEEPKAEAQKKTAVPDIAVQEVRWHSLTTVP